MNYTIDKIPIFPDDKSPINSIHFDKNGVPWIAFILNGKGYGRRKAPKSYFESLGIEDITDEYGRPTED